MCEKVKTLFPVLDDLVWLSTCLTGVTSQHDAHFVCFNETQHLQPNLKSDLFYLSRERNYLETRGLFQETTVIPGTLTHKLASQTEL